MLTLLVLGTLVGLVMALVADGALAWSGAAVLVAFASLLVAAIPALVRPRRRREPEVAADGTRVFRAPVPVVAGLLVAWSMLLGVAALWAYLAVTDFDALESPGFALVTIVGALASLPDLVRLVTGRLHRWTLELGPSSVSYRGYRTDVTVPCRDLRGAAIQRRNPAGVRIDLRAAAEDIVVPITAFDVPAEQLVEEVHRARKAASGR
ncbi:MULTISPECIES: hypothetical protein [Nocardioides]|uniref:DUF5673 domain-containing protein n=1 Tax=Nocardioides vastitatis TaxID=2568655 RepID=A0ABW0ZK29_9ACTN|nr:hypothetical protein [Nocardioides sp.]THJ04468.1 hypothetical protein E7Z54_08225 [Nocardioides sp.]